MTFSPGALRAPWAFQPLFAARFPRVQLLPQAILVDQGRVVTAGGATSFINLTLLLVEWIFGAEVARSASKMFLVDPNKAPQGAYAMFATQKLHADEDVLRAQSLIERSTRGLPRALQPTLGAVAGGRPTIAPSASQGGARENRSRVSSANARTRAGRNRLAAWTSQTAPTSTTRSSRTATSRRHTPRHAHGGGPVPHGDRVHLGRRGAWEHAHDAAQPWAAERVLDHRGALHGGGHAAGHPEGPAQAQGTARALSPKTQAGASERSVHEVLTGIE